jgi:hypothetical protein
MIRAKTIDADQQQVGLSCHDDAPFEHGSRFRVQGSRLREFGPETANLFNREPLNHEPF